MNQIRPVVFLSALLLCASAAVPAAAQSQRMGIPSYFYPGPLWSKLEAAAPTEGIAIINPNSGPGDKIDPAYTAQVKELKAHHVTVLGYVHTSYAKRAFSEVQDETARYFKWYDVDGIMFDEVTNTHADVGYYLKCREAARAGRPKAFVVLNPGTQVDESYMTACDVVITFEDKLEKYTQGYSAPDWISKYPARRFWHIILSAPTDADMQSAVRISKQRHAGWVFVTPFGDPNPYDKLPDDPYWTDLITAIRTP